jgi:hypothetical protein
MQFSSHRYIFEYEQIRSMPANDNLIWRPLRQTFDLDGSHLLDEIDLIFWTRQT